MERVEDLSRKFEQQREHRRGLQQLLGSSSTEVHTQSRMAPPANSSLVSGWIRYSDPLYLDLNMHVRLLWILTCIPAKACSSPPSLHHPLYPYFTPPCRGEAAARACRERSSPSPLSGPNARY